MMSALNEVGQPCAPLNGVYYRMEDDDVQKRFNNGFRMEILNDVAHVEKGKGKRRKSYICKLTDDEDALIIDWSSVDPILGHSASAIWLHGGQFWDAGGRREILAAGRKILCRKG